MIDVHRKFPFTDQQNIHGGDMVHVPHEIEGIGARSGDIHTGDAAYEQRRKPE
jgi:hypothetical protein